MLKRLSFTGLALLLMLSFALAACSSNRSDSRPGSNSNSSSKAANLGQKTITLLGDNYQSATASMYVAKQVLEDVGYNVQIKQVGVGTMFAGLAKGSADASLAVWLPHTHASYWKKYKDKLDKMGVLMNKVPLGLTVPAYMKNINSIEDLANNKDNIGDKLNWKITGISAGAGEMKVTKQDVLPAYGMDKKWQVVTSSGPAMIAALKKAEQNKEPIVVTLWYPHWAFVKWDLKLLKDPKNKYGDPDDIYAVARKGLKKDAPAAYKILSQFHWTKEQDEKVMLKLQKGVKPDKAAQEFVKNHPKLK
ncbi:MAG TPA: glycine betaine ABC transporter substrate-binding protein, partial [Bacillales bacterium]|nr:glycine betaine ABC transporter substrate-binding protein [Bacillales bacterium]